METLEERLKELKCVNGAMYFGAVETPCSGRETGECCRYEQTYEEAFEELKNFILLDRATRDKELRGEVEMLWESTEARFDEIPGESFYKKVQALLAESK
jgi:hypothetical protein